MTNESSPSPRAGPNPMSYTEHPAHGGAAVMSDAEPLSDAWFERIDRQRMESGLLASDAALMAKDHRYHRDRVRELEAERDDLRDVLRVVGECGDGCGHCRAIAEHHAGLRATVEGLIGERDDLRRQVEAARRALDALVREAGAGNQAARAIAIYREAIAALVPQTGEVGS